MPLPVTEFQVAAATPYPSPTLDFIVDEPYESVWGDRAISG